VGSYAARALKEKASPLFTRAFSRGSAVGFDLEPVYRYLQRKEHDPHTINEAGGGLFSSGSSGFPLKASEPWAAQVDHRRHPERVS
jgi:hypothetical protein